MASHKLKLSALALGVSSALLSTQVAASELEPQNKILHRSIRAKLSANLATLKNRTNVQYLGLLSLTVSRCFQ